MSFRTDRHNNPTAFTTDLARQAGLINGIDYVDGEPFEAGGHQYKTAKLLKDPIDTTIRLIDHISFYTIGGNQRWVYIAIPSNLWVTLTKRQKVSVIEFMYHREGGTELQDLFSI